MESENDKIVRLAKEWEAACCALAANNDASRAKHLSDAEDAARRDLLSFLRMVRLYP